MVYVSQPLGSKKERKWNTAVWPKGIPATGDLDSTETVCCLHVLVLSVCVCVCLLARLLACLFADLDIYIYIYIYIYTHIRVCVYI